MKFKKLYEEYTSDDLYQELIDYIYERLLEAVDNLAMQAASDIAEYDPDYCSEEPNNYSMEADNKLRQAAEYFAEFLLKEAPEIIHEDVKGRPSGSKNRMRLEIAGEPYSVMYAKQKNGIKNALYGQNIKDIIRSIDDDHSDDYFDYGWEDDDDIGAEYGLYINKKPFGYSSNRGKLIRIDSRYINNVNELLNYISKAFSYVNEGRYDRAAIVTPRGNILVDYGASNEFEESLKESKLREDFDASKFIGKPLKDFLRTIDHRTKINVSSENGFDTNGGYGNTTGMSGLAHDAGWYLADKKITDIKVPQDKRFYDYSIFIENLD